MDTPDKHTHFQSLKRALHALTAAPSPQPALFPESVATPDELALDYDNWASVVRGNYEHDLSELQRQSLAAIDRRLSELSDGSLEMWTAMPWRTTPRGPRSVVSQQRRSRRSTASRNGCQLSR